MIYAALKRLGKHSFIYALGPAVNKVLGFVLLPFVTVWIGTTADYGVLEIASVTIAIAAQVLGINLLHGMTRFHAQYETEEERNTLVTTTLILLASTTGIALACAWIFRDAAAELLFESSTHAPVLVAVFAILFFQTIGQVGLRWLQILERSITYGVVTSVKLLLELGLKVWLLLLGLKVMGALYSVLGCEALAALVLVGFVVKKVGLHFSWPMARRLFVYSAPLFISGLCMFALHQSDRFFVQRMCGEADVGLYGLAYKLGTIGNAVLLEAFGLIWFPFAFSLATDEEMRQIARKVLTYFNLAMCTVTLVLAVFAKELVVTMAAPQFREVWPALAVIAAGYLFWGLYQIVSTVFYRRERTWAVGVIACGAALFNILLNALLVPRFGYMGAAYSTLATFATLAIVTWLAAERLMPIGYELRRIVWPMALATVLYALSAALPDWSFASVVAAKIVLVLLLPLVLFATGFLAPEERAKISEIWRTLRAARTVRSK
ncbi:MAG: oligosaccharide flippase family protein [Planctomycetota bacterium]|nr:oligosaccharide flippase family protein [Planctomycetota bacterium]